MKAQENNPQKFKELFIENMFRKNGDFNIFRLRRLY